MTPKTEHTALPLQDGPVGHRAPETRCKRQRPPAMPVNDPAYEALDKALARKGRYDGRLLIGQMTAGIYGLPSCTRRPLKNEEIFLFTTETAAKYAGLKACKICRPDKLYSGEQDNLRLFALLRADVSGEPTRFPNVESLGAHAGVEAPRLLDLLRDHAHALPAKWLNRVKLEQAAKALIGTSRKVSEIAAESGFASKVDFEDAFFERVRMLPEDYRGINPARGFSVGLPKGYRADEILAYLGRDPASLSERRDGNRVLKTLTVNEDPVILEVTVGKATALAKAHAENTLSRQSAAEIHAAALAVLGLNGDDVSAFERQHSEFVGTRTGLRVPLLPDAFDALCWGIIGQQINIRFASTLRRRMVDLAGKKIGDMRAHPSANAVANINAADLVSRQFSRSKSHYLLGAAQAVASGSLDLANLATDSAVAAENALTALNGVGTWTARYVLMRTGFSDAAPVGDSGLATALQRIKSLPDRPDPDHTARLMANFAPYRALASMHLWTSLNDPI